MKIHVFGGIALVSMAATSALVWSSTSTPRDRTASASSAPSAPGSTAPPDLRAPVPTPNAPAEPVVDRSTFTAGETLMVEGRLGHAVVAASSDSETYLFLEVKADGAGVATVGVPLELSIVIDRSGSMRGKRLQNALDAAKIALDRLRDGDVVSVLTYNTRAEVVVAPTVVDAQTRLDIARRLRTIRAQGDTCISCGVESGMRLLGRSPNMVSRLLLLSDGEATHGVREVEGFNAIADQVRAMGASITSIGVDLDYNERIMAALARRSNGRHYFVESAANLANIFEQEMQSLATTVASNTELQVALAPGVVLDHVYDRTFQWNGNGVSVPMGSFTAGESKTLLMRVRVPRGQAGDRPIARVTSTYTDLVKGRQGNCEGELIARATDDPSQVSPLDGLVSMRISRSETAEALEQANALFRSGNELEARSLLVEKRKDIDRRRRSKQWAPASRAGAMDEDFTRQDKVLLDAADAFDSPFDGAAGVGKAAASQPATKAQIRRNQEAAVDLSL